MTPTVLRVGVVGVGDHGRRPRRAARAAHGAARLVAVADPATSGLESWPRASRACAPVADALELIGADDVDAVILASPGFVHEEQVLACLAAGKPVLCEKPLTMDSSRRCGSCAPSRSWARRPLIQVGFMRRFDPEYAELNGARRGGSLGRTLVLHNVAPQRAAVPNADFRSEMIVRDSLVHEVDVARCLFGEEVVAIQVVTGADLARRRGCRSTRRSRILTMAGGGIVTNEVFVNSQVGYEVRCEAVAERGSPPSVVRACTPPPCAADGAGRRGGASRRTTATRFATAYDLEVQAWVDAALRGEAVGPSAWDGYAADSGLRPPA